MNKMILLSSTLLLAAGCAATPKSTVQVPDALRPGAGEKLVQVVPAKGDQIYECREKKDQAGAYDWAFVAPQAALFDGSGKPIGKHYAGPSWEAADGSKIVGKVKQLSASPAARAIPWLLLETKSAGAEGAFSRVTSIQRVATVGGVAPAGGCPQAGTQIRVPYTADYYFFSVK